MSALAIENKTVVESGPDNGGACSVVCLVLQNHEGAVLATQRPEGKRLAGYWEFPGGKIEPGEPAEDALRREIREELDMELGELHPLHPAEHRYEFGTIRLIPFLAACQGSAFSLNEHADARWLRTDELASVRWSPADIPIVKQLQELP